MDVFIYFPPNLQTPRDEIEDALDACLGACGEVTGSGAGDSGSNIDLEISDDDGESLLESVRETLRTLRVPAETILVVDGIEMSL